MARKAVMKMSFILLAAGVLATAVLRPQPRAPRAAPGSREPGRGTRVVPDQHPVNYPDHRPAAHYRLEARDQGVVFRHGHAPHRRDELGARDVWVWKYRDTYYMNYDGAGPQGWLACLATSRDLAHWTPHGPVLDFGKPGSEDAASASYGSVYFDGTAWRMFYVGTPHATPAPDYVPGFPYLTMYARGRGPAGPWVKDYNVIPFRPKPGTYYSTTASPGIIVKRRGEYLMFFSASVLKNHHTRRTLSIARTRDLDGAWKVDAQPILPLGEQVENSSLYYEKANQTWFLFTNHVGLKQGLEYTDAIWVYWSKDPNHWNPAHKAVVLDARNCAWSKDIIGLPSVLQVGGRLAVFYDGNGSGKLPPGVESHMRRDVGLAWLNLPLIPPGE
jgi:predicted GH43/DUF377 family glycosyl hydrolase